MSDMSRPFPAPSPPSPPDHERHDPLLVAQYVEGDPLSETQHRQAQQIVAACSACAALAEDLRAISGAVAWEPVPPRRRDFRLGLEQAERLGGNPVSRLLRRFSVPRSRAFGPLAAGIMSIGLAFVVAGSIWPDSGSLSAPDEAPPGLEMRLQRTAAPPSSLEAPVAADQADLDVGGTGAADAFMLQETVEGSLEPGSAMKSSASEPRVADEARTAVDSLAGAAGGVPGAEVDTANASVPGGPIVPGVDGDAAAVVTPATGGLQSAALITLIGLALAVAGGLALLLAWLARRLEDPLLR